MPSWGSLEDGLLNPTMLKDEKVIVFVTHAHDDHFCKDIFELRKDISDLNFVLSDDIMNINQYNEGDLLSVHWWKEYDLDDVHITTLRSTDEGVAFLVEVDGIKIYYAGDLNWWYWKGEDEETLNEVTKEYQQEIDSLIGKQIDLVFVPMDPRLEENYILSTHYVMETLKPSYLFPMHFWGQYEIFKWLGKEEMTKDYLSHIKEITHIGQLFEFHV